jgi:hypothetical protein
VQPDEERAAADGKAQLRERDAQESAPGAEAERGGAVLECRIETPERCRKRQVEKGKIGQNGNKDAAEEAMQGGHQAHPGIALDEGGHGQRGDEQPGP